MYGSDSIRCLDGFDVFNDIGCKLARLIITDNFHQAVRGRYHGTFSLSVQYEYGRKAGSECRCCIIPDGPCRLSASCRLRGFIPASEIRKAAFRKHFLECFQFLPDYVFLTFHRISECLI